MIEAAQMFVMVEYVKNMTMKKFCKYGEYGLFEHLLFLFIGIIGPINWKSYLEQFIHMMDMYIKTIMSTWNQWWHMKKKTTVNDNNNNNKSVVLHIKD